MRLLTLFLVITKIFILFNLVSISDSFSHHHGPHHHNNNRNTLSDGYNGNNNHNNQAMSHSPKSSSNSVVVVVDGGVEKDNIASTLPQSFNGITEEVIRNGKLEEPSPSSRVAISLYDDLNRNDNNQERGALYRHHSSPQTSSSSSAHDDSAPESKPLYLKEDTTTSDAMGSERKTNSLIEWVPEKQSNFNGALSNQYEHYHHYRHYNQTNHNVRNRRNGMNTSSLFNTDKLEHELVADTRSKWCHKLCDISSSPVIRHNHHLICASNGRFYSSSCELKRYSCRHNVQLFKKPKIYCSKHRQNQHAKSDDSDSVATNNTEEVRIVELKKRCNKLELDEMKKQLLEQFDGNLASLFRYFDSNGDNYIEAHELWPRKDIESNKLMYAQVWDDHSTKCPSHKLNILDHHLQDGYRLVEDQLKCWFFLDFAFQPKFAANPCSLSHLMLFDLRHPSSKFDWDSFQNAFKFIQETSSSVRDQKTYRNYSQIDIILGESADLHCFDNGSNSLSSFLMESNFSEDNDVDNYEQVKCLWTRYNLNLAALRDPHIHVGEQIVEQSQIKDARDFILFLKDAQLYLSGQFKCTCDLKNSLRKFEHIYNVRILGK